MLTIPQRFKDGLDKKVSTVYPIVVIEKLTTSEAELYTDIIRLSQKKGLFDGEYYEDRDLRISAIKESINIKDKNFKTNQINISVSNYTHNNERFSDKFSKFNFVNSRASIYYANANCKSLDDCLLVFKGFIKDYKGGNDKISFKVEDHTQNTLDDKSFPRYKTYDPAAETIEKSKNAFFPITYGHNEKAPLIFHRSNRINTISQIYPDSIFRNDIEIEGFVFTGTAGNEKCISVFREDQYNDIPKQVSGLPLPFIVNGKDYADPASGYNGTEQYELSDENDLILLNKKIQDEGHSQGLSGNLQAREQFLCETIRRVTGTSVDSSGHINWGEGDNSSIYMGPEYGYDIIETSNPESESKIFQFPEASNPASFVERGFYNNLTLSGFRYKYQVIPDGQYDYDTEYDSRGGVFFLAYMMETKCNVVENGQNAFDMLYMPEPEEITPFLNEDISYDSIEWYYATDLVQSLHPSGEYYNTHYFAGPAWSYVSGAYPSIQDYVDCGVEGEASGISINYLSIGGWSYAGIKFTIGDEEVDLGLDEDASEYFNPQVYAWITNEGEVPTLRKILWGRRLYWGSGTTPDETGWKFNQGAMVYGLFPTFAKNTINSSSSSQFHYYEQSAGRYTAGRDVQLNVDSLYSFMNPYLRNPNNPLDYGGFNSLTESLDSFDHAIYDGSQLIAVPFTGYSNSNYFNESNAIVAYEKAMDESSNQAGASTYYHFEPSLDGIGTPALYGGAWCPIDWVQGAMNMAKINLTFNSISGTDVIEGGVYSRFRGLVYVNLAKIGSDSATTYNPEFGVEIDAIREENNASFSDAIIYLNNPEALSLTPLDPETYEPSGYSTYNTNSHYPNDFIVNDGAYIFTECNKFGGQFDDDGVAIPDQWRDNVNSINSLSLVYSLRSDINTNSSLQCVFNTTIHNFELHQKFIIENISNQKYFGNVKGRIDDSVGTYTGDDGSLIEKPSDILLHIMEKELGYSVADGFDEDSLNVARVLHDTWKFAFSVNEEIDAKDFIKDFAQSTKFVPRFRHDGTLSFVNIPESWAVESMEIQSKDVISFSYSKTPISEVKLMVQVNYQYDIGLDEYQACTNTGNGGAIPKDYEKLQEMYGIKNLDDAFLRFESKYIRNEATAKKLRNYLLEWFKNQHNIIECTLPSIYMALECGDIVGFDSLIQDTKIFGQDYTQGYLLHDQLYVQTALPQFLVQEITKSQDKVKVKLIQLHTIDYNNIIEEYSLIEDYTGFWMSPELDVPGESGVNEYLLGDFNQDGYVNVLDAVLIVNYVIGNSTNVSNQSLLSSDVNQDSFVDILDIVTIVNSIISGTDLGTIEV